MNKSLTAFIALALTTGACSKSKNDDQTPAQPAIGHVCPGGTTNRRFIVAQAGGSAPGGYIESATGTTISSISFRNVHVFNGNYSSFQFAINVRACDFSSSSIGTSTATLTNFFVGDYRTVTFNFSPAITIPTNCASGKKTIAFQVSPVTTQNTGEEIVADVGAFDATTCPSQYSSTSTSGLGTPESGKAFSTTVVAQ